MKSTSQLVSIITPIYNGERFLGEAIKSAQAQSYQHFEHIFIDDGSSDSSLKIIERAKEADPERVVIIRNEKPSGGPAGPRNQGVVASRGKLIAFLDQDDFWEKDRLEKQIAEFSADEEIMLCYSPLKILEQSTGKVLIENEQAVPAYLRRGTPRERLLKSFYIPILTTMVKKEALLQAGLFDPRLLGTDDLDIWFRILKRGKIKKIEKPLATWRMQKGSISSDKELTIKNHIKFFKNILAKHKLTAKEKSLATKGLVRNWRMLGFHYLEKGRLGKATRCFGKAHLLSKRNSTDGLLFFGAKYTPKLLLSTYNFRASIKNKIRAKQGLINFTHED